MQEAYLGEAALMLEVSDLHAYYGKSHILQGVDTSCRRRRDRQPARPQRRRPLHHFKAIMGEVPPQGSITFKGESIAGLRAVSDRASGHRLCPGGPRYLSEPDGAAEPDAGRQAGTQGTRWRISMTCLGCFPTSPQRADTPAGVLSGGETADADDVPDPDGRPRSHHDRRADRGAGAA